MDIREKARRALKKSKVTPVLGAASRGPARSEISDMTPGFKAVARRMDQAEDNFLETLMMLGGINIIEARRVLARYRIHKLVKMDAVGGRITVKHGAFLDRDAIRKAAEP